MARLILHSVLYQSLKHLVSQSFPISNLKSQISNLKSIVPNLYSVNLSQSQISNLKSQIDRPNLPQASSYNHIEEPSAHIQQSQHPVTDNSARVRSSSGASCRDAIHSLCPESSKIPSACHLPPDRQ
ncbi:hypothetical protein NDI43_08660 [Microcoleus vaginatus GB2-A3]|uniref:hypothetical protein n=1 Tax=Microcoleus vaginatus TaxID=119532 RepID=UPI0032AD861C